MAYEFFHGVAIPRELSDLVPKLEALFGEALDIVSIDEEWLRFHVSGRTDASVLSQLQANAAQVFGPNLWHYQVLCSNNVSPAERGVWIRSVRNAEEKNEIRPGFWFY